MRKMLLKLSVVGLTMSSVSPVVACSWTTPPLKVEQLRQIMAHLQSQSGYNNHNPGSIVDLGIIGTLPMPKPTIDDLQNPTDQKAITNARTASDNITNLVSTYVTNNVNQQKSLTGTDDSNFYQNNNLNASLFKAAYFSVRMANIYGINDASTTSKWLYDGVSNPDVMTNFKWKDKNDTIITFSNQNQLPAEGQGGNYSYLNIDKLWEKGKIFNLDTTNNIIILLKTYQKTNTFVYTIRFLITFSPQAKFNFDPIYFYVSADFSD
ncbi:hypothetical protein [Spiroplasma sp. SV19]|uniref:hypothetical protein n=1 Tax=Spiroplasma sp. SV19 TaxID=2570468 RepID=UPI0024B68D81|nr:hypothetical protein [Spiroplasma sp. SV19]WHQ37242.1 hypothetical protein E7Y35_05075 [Spiroplasma sp. SV19]